MATNFVFIVPSYNSADWVGRNIGSILSQTYTRWRVIYIDDASTDGTADLVKRFVGKADRNKSPSTYNDFDRFSFVVSKENLGPAASRYTAYQMAEDDEVLCMLDGDDWLPGPNVLKRISELYDVGFEATWGSYLRFENGRIEPTLLPFFDKGGWFCRHMRTMKASLIKDIPLELLQIDGGWIRCCSDMAESGWVESKTNPAQIRMPTCIYNVDNSKRHPTSQYRPKEMSEYKKKVEIHVRSFFW